MKIVGNTIEAPRLRVRLERTHEKRIHLAAHVERRVGVPENGKLEIHLANRIDGFRDEKMVLEWNDGVIDSDQPAALTTISARMSPFEVWTSQEPPERSMPVTAAWRMISAPRDRAPFAKAWVTPVGSTYPSDSR